VLVVQREGRCGVKKNLYTTGALPGEHTVAAIADLAHITEDIARTRLSKGRRVAGHKWTRVNVVEPVEIQPRARTPRTQLTAPGYEGTVTYADLQRLGNFRHQKTAIVYVTQGTPIAGFVWTRVNPRRCHVTPARLEAAKLEAAQPKPAPSWHKPAAAPAPAPSAEPRRFAMAWESDLMPVNGMRILPRLDSGMLERGTG
jgi:hypothetical protein